MATELLLVRHGESEGNTGVSKDPDCPLTMKGVEQARRSGLRLARHDLRGFTFITSPYRRAVQTAAEIFAATGMSFTTDEQVREWGVVATIDGREYAAEAADELVTRLREFLREREGQKLVVVSHAAPIALLTQLAWGETPNTDGPFWSGVGNCCLRWLRTTCE